MAIFMNLIFVAFFALNFLSEFLLTTQEKETTDANIAELRQKAESEYDAFKVKLGESYHQAAAKIDEWMGDEEGKDLHQDSLNRVPKSEEIKEKIQQRIDEELNQENEKSVAGKFKQFLTGIVDDKGKERRGGVKEQGSHFYEEAIETGQHIQDKVKEGAEFAVHGAKSMLDKMKEWVAGEKGAETDKFGRQEQDGTKLAQKQEQDEKDSVPATFDTIKKIFSDKAEEIDQVATETFNSARDRAKDTISTLRDQVGEAVDKGKESAQPIFDAAKSHIPAKDTFDATYDETD